MKWIMKDRLHIGRRVTIVFPIRINHTMERLVIEDDVTINGNVEIFGKGKLVIGERTIISKGRILCLFIALF